VAAIDIGSNSIRMVVAQVLPDGKLEMLEQLRQAARLGQDTFRRGRLGGQTMRAAVGILRDYRKVIDFYKVEQVRAVATSAVREASNSDAFIDRVFMATGFDVEVIDTPEESRLTVSAVRREIADALGKERANVLIVDVGGGSTLLTILVRGEIATSQSVQLGSIRLQESLMTADEPPDRATEILRHQISNVIAAVQSSLPLNRAQTYVAVGGDARFAAGQIGQPTASPALSSIARSNFDKLVRRCESHTPEELSKIYGMPFADAETLKAALLVYHALFQVTRARQMLVSQVTMRDGLLLDLALTVTGQEDESISKGVIFSAMAVAEKYRVDVNHSRNVSDLAVRLFDQLQSEHGLNPRHRLLLRVAGLVHEIGGFVSSRAHHKHSYYLIANSEIFGLTREEVNIVAHVGRYHRRSCPKPSHVEYMMLPRENRMLVSKLAALLRVADALDHTHSQQIRDLRCERRGDEMVILVPAPADLTIERRELANKGDLFEDIYGLRVRAEESSTTT